MREIILRYDENLQQRALKTELVAVKNQFNMYTKLSYFDSYVKETKDKLGDIEYDMTVNKQACESLNQESNGDLRELVKTTDMGLRKYVKD
jgi:hypothetical protein